MSCENCLSRREFLAASAAAAVSLAGCGDGDVGGPGITTPGGSKQITISEFPDLAVSGRLVVVDTQRLVKRTGPTTFLALSSSCTHEGTQVNIVEDGASLLCPNHFSRFDTDGNVIVGPAPRRLTVLATSYNAATDVLTIG
jgi:cytochrome b6-f complex iron-sulfur subunit